MKKKKNNPWVKEIAIEFFVLFFVIFVFIHCYEGENVWQSNSNQKLNFQGSWTNEFTIKFNELLQQHSVVEIEEQLNIFVKKSNLKYYLLIALCIVCIQFPKSTPGSVLWSWITNKFISIASNDIYDLDTRISEFHKIKRIYR